MEDYIIANCTDTGKVRTVNEDSMATFDSPNGRVLVVCDGMGGQNAGDVASQLAVSVVQDILTDNKFATPEEAISKSIMAANQAILVRASHDQGLTGMGATCVMLIISDGKVYYGSVGDSRIYYVSADMIRQLTKDQSYVQTLVDAGELTQEAAEHHQDKNQITNALGIEGMTPPVVCQMPITPDPNSVFLLCSDGLSGMVSNKTIAQVISNKSLSLQEKAKELIRLANNAGGIDNITVQLVQFPASPMGKGFASNGVSGNGHVRKPLKSKATKYWVMTLVCLALAIGGTVYWFVSEDKPQPVKKESRPKASVPARSEDKVKKTQVNIEMKDTPQQTESVIKEQTKDDSRRKVAGTDKNKKMTGKKEIGKDKKFLEKPEEQKNVPAPEDVIPKTIKKETFDKEPE